MSRSCFWSALAVVVVAATAGGVARADGAFPDSLTIIAPTDQPRRIALATNFGLISSDDAGASWSWVCEDALTNCTTFYTASAAPADRLYALSADRLVFSDDDACEWTVSGGADATGGFVDAFPLAQDAERVLAVLSPNGVGAQTTYTVVESHDGGATFDTVLYTAASGDLVTGVEASRADADTIYVTLGAGSSFAPTLAVTTDAGAHWQTVDLSATLGASTVIRLVAVDRANPDRVYLRVGLLTGEGIGVYDATTGAVTVPLAFPGGLMTAFVQTAEGPLVVAGREDNDGPVFRSLDDGETWTPVVAPPHVRALAERDGTIYVAADDTVDGYALGASTDLGVTFAPLMRLAQVGAVAACVRASCQAVCKDEVTAGLWPASTCTAAPEMGPPKPAASGGGGCALSPTDDRGTGLAILFGLASIARARSRAGRPRARRPL